MVDVHCGSESGMVLSFGGGALHDTFRADPAAISGLEDAHLPYQRMLSILISFFLR